MVDNVKTVNGNGSRITVERARGELRHGRAVLVKSGQNALLVGALEALSEDVCAAIRDLADGKFNILLNWRRATALGLNGAAKSAVQIDLVAPQDQLSVARQIAFGASEIDETAFDGPYPSVGTLVEAILQLCRLAQLVPAVVVAPVSGSGNEIIDAGLESGDILAVNATDILDQTKATRSVERVSEAKVPMAGAENSRFIAYRGPAPSDEQVAVIIGSPDLSEPVPIRIHSACLTGDVFGSMRCDCGEQLQATIEKLQGLGGGVIVYLAQEGRGIGLTNKLRAYQLQDVGNDTYDANARLGFEPDERRFDIAGSILSDLGITAVRLLTNNPRKVQALRAEGINVVDRLPLSGGLTQYNAAYLTTKVKKGGHYDEAVALDSERGTHEANRDEQDEGFSETASGESEAAQARGGKFRDPGF